MGNLSSKGVTASHLIRHFDFVSTPKEKDLPTPEFKMSDWKNSMLGCFGNRGTCCCVSWCYPCAVYRDAEALNKSGLLCGLLSCIVPCIPTMLLRSEAREKYGIEGSTAGDAVAAFCCTPCVQCQVGNEIEERGYRS